MTNPGTELEKWLAGGDIIDEQYPGADDWIAGFDADRQAVVVKLGPFKRLYLRPDKFTKRFYHQLYPLAVEIWPYRRQLKLFDDFCALELSLDLRFQATLAYVQRHSELLPTINQHIKQTYADLLDDTINRELQQLGDGRWVQTGLSPVEQNITRSICEFLAVQQIQSQAVCRITASFEEFPPVQPGRENVYLNVLKKTFEVNDLKNREMVRQQRLLEQQEFEEKRRHLEHLRQLIDLDAQAQAIEAEKKQRLLEEREEQLSRQLLIEKRIHAQQLKHDVELQEMELEKQLQFEELRQAKQRSAEIRQLNEQLVHLAQIEDAKIIAELARKENVESRTAE